MALGDYDNKVSAAGQIVNVKKDKISKIKRAHNKYSLSKPQSAKSVEPVSAEIIYGSGTVDIKTTGEVYGVQIKYSGNMNITSKHQKHTEMSIDNGGWIMVANNSTGKLLYFSFNGKPITGSEKLFTYRGNVKFTDVVVSGNSTQIRGILKKLETHKFKDLQTNFNKLNTKFYDLKDKGSARTTPKMFTGYESKPHNKNPKRLMKKNKNMGGSY